MFPAKSLLAFLTLAVSFTGVSASPVPAPATNLATLPFKRSLNLPSLLDIVHADQARAQAMKSTPGGVSKRKASIMATNAVVTYTADIGVGTPPTQYTLLIDTGSSNTWVGADKAYVKTGSSVNTLESVSVTYGSGSFTGTEYIDSVTLGPGLTITKQSIGVASNSQGFSGVDGILGIGPVDLTQGTVVGQTTVPTVTDNLLNEKIIKYETIGISYEPTNTESVVNGELTFGGTDPLKYTCQIAYTPITTTSPASAYWGIDQTITYGDNTPILSITAGIVDTGTTLILIASDAFSAYQAATGGVLDSATGLLKITQAQYENLKPLNFKVGGSTWALPPNGQIFPRSLNTDVGGSADGIYLIVASIGSPSGQGLDFINGYAFLERFYSVYDTTNQQVGFATTIFTDAITN